MDSKKLKNDAFENVRDQIGSCGIWCGSCVVGNGVLRELTRRYEKLIKDYGLREWAPKEIDFKEFMKGLTSIQAMPLCSGCLKGGGRDNCEIRACVTEKDFNDCSECQESETCKHKKLLEHMRTGALRAGLFVKAEKDDRRRLLGQWCAELERRWPCCILFRANQKEQKRVIQK